MVFDAKRMMDSISRDEGIASCLMQRITVTGYKVFKVNHLHSILVMIVLVSCSRKYFLTINATSRHRKFAVIVHCSHTLKSQVEPYQRIC